MTTPAATRYIIQLDRPGDRLDMATVSALLEPAGVELDRSYGPILVNRSLGRYVVRGTASPDARAQAEQLGGVRFFSETRQEPMVR